MDVALFLSLLGVVAVSLTIRAYQPCMAATALLLNLVLCTVGSDILGSGFNYMLLASVDLLTAVAILLMPTSRGQILLAGTYVFALCCHAAFASVGDTIKAEDAYWLALYYMAWGQLCITIVWTGVELAGLVRSGNHSWCRIHTRRHLSRQVDKHGAEK